MLNTLGRRFLGSDCVPGLRHSAIIFCTRAQGRSNQHGTGEDILR
jgi:hypothetical protein